MPSYGSERLSFPRHDVEPVLAGSGDSPRPDEPIAQPRIELPTRSQHGFQRTVCDCEFCRAPCRHVPGSLDVADLDKLCPQGQDIFAWAEQHLRAVIDKPYPTLVPARHEGGACHWHYEGRCLVHAHAPYSCAFFDMHMDAAEIARRSAATIASRQKDADAEGLYFRVWLYLQRRGLTAPAGNREALNDELRKKFARRTSLG